MIKYYLNLSYVVLVTTAVLALVIDSSAKASSYKTIDPEPVVAAKRTPSSLAPWPQFKQAPTQQYFHGYACKGNCSGHIAGWNWAERKDLEVESQCGGKSRSFYEGCLAYVGYIQDQGASSY